MPSPLKLTISTERGLRKKCYGQNYQQIHRVLKGEVWYVLRKEAKRPNICYISKNSGPKDIKHNISMSLIPVSHLCQPRISFRTDLILVHLLQVCPAPALVLPCITELLLT